MEKINGLKIKPIRINCRTCKGEKKVIREVHNDFLDVVPQRFADTTPANILRVCPTCEGKGYYEVKKL